jgi:hypothetical protein
MNNIEKIKNKETFEVAVKDKQSLKDLELVHLRRNATESLMNVIVGSDGVNVTKVVQQLINEYAAQHQEEHYLKMKIIEGALGKEATLEILESSSFYRIDWALETLVVN